MNVGHGGQGALLELSPGLKVVQVAGGREKGRECPGWDVTGTRQERRLRAAHKVSEKASLGRSRVCALKLVTLNCPGTGRM